MPNKPTLSQKNRRNAYKLWTTMTELKRKEIMEKKRQSMKEYWASDAGISRRKKLLEPVTLSAEKQ